MTIGIKMNAQQFLMLGPDPPGTRLELVHGDIIVSPSPSYDHSYADRLLSTILVNHILEFDLGELVGDVDTIFGGYDVRRPDIIFNSKAKAALRDRNKHGLHFSPDLCVEIISPGSAAYDEDDKFALYLEHQVPNYWLVYPVERSFVAYQLRGDRYVEVASGREEEIVSAEPFPKLKIPLARLWAPAPGG